MQHQSLRFETFWRKWEFLFFIMSDSEDRYFKNYKSVNYCSAITGLGLELWYFSMGSEEVRTYPGNRFCHYPPILLANVPSLEAFILSFFLLLVVSVWCWSTWGIDVFLRRTFSPLPISFLSFLWLSFIDFEKSEVMIMCLWEVSVCLSISP